MKSLRLLIAIFPIILFAACGGGGGGGSSSSSGTTTTTPPADLSSAGVDTASIAHNEYLVGSHSTMSCNDCHAAAKPVDTGTQGTLQASSPGICVSCHQSDYDNAANFNHSSYSAGTHCNQCHYSDSFTSRARVEHTVYHESLTGTCTSCHASRQPAGHYSADCQTCHSYSSGNWAVSNYSHSGISGNCKSCHSSDTPSGSWRGWTHARNFAGYECEWCHTNGFSWDFSFSEHGHRTSMNSQSCSACHGSTFGDSNDGGDDNDGNDGNDGNDDNDGERD